MKSKEEYIESLAAQLKEWSEEIDALNVKMENAADDVKRHHAEEVEALRAKQRAATEKMQELKEASGDAWDAIKETADQVWDDLKAGVTSVMAKFK